MGKEIKINQTQVRSFLNATEGPVLTRARRLAQRIKQGAQAQVGVKSGKLRRSIYARVDRGVRGPSIRVGSTSPIARVHHDGTKRHVIVPRSASVLRFPVRGGAIVFAQRVRHPGTRPNRFLTDQLKRGKIKL